MGSGSLAGVLMAEFLDLFGEWATHQVTVWKRIGQNAQGDVYDSLGVNLDEIMVTEQRKVIVRPDGTRTTSIATIYCDPAELSVFGDKARVQLPSGDVGRVASISHLDVNGLIGHGVVEVE